MTILRAEIGAEKEVPGDEAVGLVRVRLLDPPRMVPAMHFWTAHDVVQPSEPNVAVAVLEDSAHRIEDEIGCNYGGTGTYQNEGRVSHVNCSTFSAG